MENFKFIEDRVFDALMSEQRVLILPEPKEKKTKSGIIKPDTSEDDTPRLGTVIRVGKGDKDTPMKYSVGDLVMTSKYSGKEIELNIEGVGFKQFLVINQIDIMMKLVEKEV